MIDFFHRESDVYASDLHCFFGIFPPYFSVKGEIEHGFDQL